MTKLFMLDTDTSSYFLKGHVDGEKKMREVPPAQVCVSAMTRAEIMYGLKAIPSHHGLQETARLFFQIVRTIAWSATAADFYAEIKRHLKITGKPVGEFDMMIAAHAVSLGAVLVTNNTKHFKNIQPGLMLDNWKIGRCNN